MSNSPKYMIGVIVLIVVVIGAFVLAGKNATPQETGPIKMGFIGPLTGDAASYGEPFKDTVQLAVDEINAKGGIDGRMIEMVYEDGKCGAAGASAAQKLVNVDKVQVIIGGFCSGETIPAVAVVEQGKVLLASPGASSPDLTGISKYFFRDYPSDSTQGKVLAEKANKDGLKKIAVIHEETEYAAGIFKVFKTSFEGGEVRQSTKDSPLTRLISVPFSQS